MLQLFLIFFATFLNGVTCKPHVIFIIADDLGWNDVSFHGSNQIPTRNIDVLGYNGIILNSHYGQAICTPSRAALLTAKFPSKLAMQGQPLGAAEPRSLPPGKLLPQYFKDLGYSTNLVGKWHLGYERWNSTPTYRGFDHFFGFYNGWVSYYDYLTTWPDNGKAYTGYDMRNGTYPDTRFVGQYATDTLTGQATFIINKHDVKKPLFLMVSHLAVHAGNDGKLLEAPQATIDNFKYIPDSNRRTYAAMVYELDKSVGKIVSALFQKNMLNDSIIVFISDNGASTQHFPVFPNWGSNYPLKGTKHTMKEGGIRSVGCIWSPLIKNPGRVSNGLMHLVDWLPTLLTAVGGDIGLLPEDVDGIDQWASLVNDLPSPRKEFLINIDEASGELGLRKNKWKLLVGGFMNGTFDYVTSDSGEENITPPVYDTFATYYTPTGLSIRPVTPNFTLQQEFLTLREKATVTCNNDLPLTPVCKDDVFMRLYDIENDPCETTNLASSNPLVVQEMLGILGGYQAKLVPQFSQPFDVRGDPKLFGYNWSPWLA